MSLVTKSEIYEKKKIEKVRSNTAVNQKTKINVSLRRAEPLQKLAKNNAIIKKPTRAKKKQMRMRATVVVAVY